MKPHGQLSAAGLLSGSELPIQRASGKKFNGSTASEFQVILATNIEAC